MAEVNLTSGIKRNLMSLQQTSRLFEDTQNNLASGRKVNTPLDSPTNWFRAENLIDRARGLEFRYDDMGQAIQTVKAADLGLSSIRSLLDTLRGVVNDALTTTESSDRRALGQQFNELLRQTANVAKDAVYNGINLLRGDPENGSADMVLKVQFHEDFNASTLTIRGFNITGPSTIDANGEADNGLRVSSSSGRYDAVLVLSHGIDGGAEELDWGSADYVDRLTSLIDSIESLDDTMRLHSKNLANNSSLVELRRDFTTGMMNTLEIGSDMITLADLNEEGANILALQTAQQLGIQSLNLANQQVQSVLRLLG